MFYRDSYLMYLVLQYKIPWFVRFQSFSFTFSYVYFVIARYAFSEIVVHITCLLISIAFSLLKLNLEIHCRFLIFDSDFCFTRNIPPIHSKWVN